MIPPPATTMAVIGERCAPDAASAAAAATARTVSDSDSDHEYPEKEPEFVIDIVDSLSQPLLIPPRHQPMQPPAAVLPFQQPRQFAPFLLPQPQLELEYAGTPKECTNCFICKIVHCILVLVCVGVTLMMAARLPADYKEGDGRGFIILCPIVIGVLAVHWLMLAQYDKEQC